MKPPPTLYSKMLAEFIGTFFLSLFISLIVQHIAYTQSTAIHPALAVGLGYTVLIYAFGRFTECYFNPLIALNLAFMYKPMIQSCSSLAGWFTEKTPIGRRLGLLYCFVQISASVSGSISGLLMSPVTDKGAKVIDFIPLAKPYTDGFDETFKAWMHECIWCFLFVLVVLNVGISTPLAVGKNNNKSSIIANCQNHQQIRRNSNVIGLNGIAIGLTVTVAMICQTGASTSFFNPALATGQALAFCFGHPEKDANPCWTLSLGYLWLYWTASLCGAFFAGIVNSILNAKEGDGFMANSSATLAAFLNEDVVVLEQQEEGIAANDTGVVGNSVVGVGENAHSTAAPPQLVSKDK